MSPNQQNESLEISEQFSVPAEQVFQAWNDPKQLKQWWQPLNNHLQEVNNDLKPGGKIEYKFEDKQLQISGEYQQVEMNKRLVYSWNWRMGDDRMKDAQYTLTVEFEGESEGSRLKIHQDGFTNEKATHPHKEGWQEALKGLKQFVEGNGSGEGREQKMSDIPTDNSRKDPGISAGGSSKDDPSLNTSNTTQENFDPAKHPNPTPEH